MTYMLTFHALYYYTDASGDEIECEPKLRVWYGMDEYGSPDIECVDIADYDDALIGTAEAMDLALNEVDCNPQRFIENAEEQGWKRDGV